MLKWLYRKIEALYDKKVDGIGLAVFRIFYSTVLLCEVSQLFYFRNLVFDKIPYVEPGEIDFTVPLVLWMASIVLLIIGCFTRTAAVINYLFTLIFLSTTRTYEYHMFYIYQGVNFLFCVTNIGSSLSIDRLRRQIRYSNTRFTYNPKEEVSVLDYSIYLLVAIAFVYFDSIFYKLASHNWTTGIGMWLPASLPFAAHVNGNAILNVKWLSIGLGYLTLIFEAAFIFLFWRRLWRVPLAIVGIGLHLGITLVFPIPWFGLGVTAIYLLMLPTRWWRWLGESLKVKSPSLTVYIDEECPLCKRTELILKYFDILDAIRFEGVQTHAASVPELQSIPTIELLKNVHAVTKSGNVCIGIDFYFAAARRIPILWLLALVLRLPGLYHLCRWVYRVVANNRIVQRCTEDECGYQPPALPLSTDGIRLSRNVTLKEMRLAAITFGFVFLFFTQISVTYQSFVVKRAKSAVGLSGSTADVVLNRMFVPLRMVGKVFFGLVSHPVFMDAHFQGYSSYVAVEAISDSGNYWLPMVSRDGTPGAYNYGFVWVKWAFRVAKPDVSREEFVKGVRDFTTFWAYRSGLDSRNLKFRIYRRKLEVPTEWTHNHLENQLKEPWQIVGEMYWNESNVFVFDEHSPIIASKKNG